METKLSKLKALMAAQDWQKAISFASRFPQLGAERAAILDAQLAYTNPAFIRGIKKDPQALIEAGRQALIRRYP